MVQEVQTQGNWYQTPNRIEWIWVSERKVSDFTQVRNQKTDTALLTSDNISVNLAAWEKFATSWTITSDDDRYYKIIGWDVYMPLAWAYWVEFIAPTNYPQQTYKYTLTVYLDNKVVFSDEQYPGDKARWEFWMNVGKKNKLRASLQYEDTASISFPIILRIIKL